MSGAAPGLAAALVLPCAELAPPEPPTKMEADAAPRFELSLAEFVWFGKRSTYADQVRGCYLQQIEDEEVLTIELSAAEGRAVLAEARAAALDLQLRTKPTWGVVAGVGGGALVVGVAAGALASRRLP